MMTYGTRPLAVLFALGCATSCEGPPEQVTPEPDPLPAVSVRVHDELLGEPVEPPKPTEPPKDTRIADARAHAKCYEMDGREGTFACALHRAGRGTPFVFNTLLLGDVSAMREFTEPVYMSGARPDPTPRSSVTMDLHSSPGNYVRPQRGWRQREKARRKGLVDATDYSTGEFFTQDPERRYDRGEAPFFMRKEDEAALRCGDTLHRFTRLSEERAQRLFDEGTFELRAPHGLYEGLANSWAKGEASTREGYPESSGWGNVCDVLLGPPDAKEERRAKKLERARTKLGEVETLREVRWCIDAKREEPWADPNAAATMTERMGEGVARDATELARRIHAVMPPADEPSRSFIIHDESQGLEPKDIKPIYRWWKGLDYGAPREAARIEVLTALYGTTPRGLRLENHTREGKRFNLTFGRCSHRELRSQDEREGRNRRRRPGRRSKEE